MSIDIDWLEREFNLPKLVDSKQILESFISDLVCSISSTEPKKEILKAFKKATPLGEDTINHQIFDSFQYAFSTFAKGGLYELYCRQENYAWHPRIVLKSVLTPNDISELPDLIDIYRGCDVSEFESKSYGQSWSISIKVAREFAYEHYSNYVGYEEKDRCILKASIKKEDVFFSRQSHEEKEIAVDIKKLANVQKCNYVNSNH